MMEAARANLSVELDNFARNTLEYLNNEKALLFDPIDVPRLKTSFQDKHVLIVVRGEGYKDDLALLKEYLRDARPVSAGGRRRRGRPAGSALETRHVILGDMDSVSDAALRCGAELVVHGYAKGDARGAPGLERIEQLGTDRDRFPCGGNQ